MPIYEYTAASPEQGCPHCQASFEVFARISDADLTQCPQCGAPLKRLISVASVVSGSAHVHNEAYFSKRGFTQYKKAGGGVYEKTAGDGPQFISGND